MQLTTNLQYWTLEKLLFEKNTTSPPVTNFPKKGNSGYGYNLNELSVKFCSQFVDSFRELFFQSGIDMDFKWIKKS